MIIKFENKVCTEEELYKLIENNNYYYFTINDGIDEYKFLYYHGDKCWYKNRELHREDGPAVEYFYGYKAWYQNGKLHREDGPAIEYASGDKSWYKNGKLHREDGPTAVYTNGNKYWYKDGKPNEKFYNLEIKHSPLFLLVVAIFFVVLNFSIFLIRKA